MNLNLISCRDHLLLNLLYLRWMTALQDDALPSVHLHPCKRTRTPESSRMSTMRLEAASHPRMTTAILALHAPRPSPHSRIRRPCPTTHHSSRRAPSHLQLQTTNPLGLSSKVRRAGVRRAGVRRAGVAFRSTKYRGRAEKDDPSHHHSQFRYQAPPMTRASHLNRNNCH